MEIVVKSYKITAAGSIYSQDFTDGWLDQCVFIGYE